MQNLTYTNQLYGENGKCRFSRNEIIWEGEEVFLHSFLTSTLDVGGWLDTTAGLRTW